MNNFATTPKTQLTRDTDGAYAATVTIKLTRDQWLTLERRFAGRHTACIIGMDNPNVTDFVMFQIFGQLGGKP